MKEWKYLIGSADDFIGAPDWATLKVVVDGGIYCFVEAHEIGMRAIAGNGLECTISEQKEVWPEIIAQRTESFGNAIDLEFCKANPNHPDCKCKEIKVTITDQQAESMQRSFDELSKAIGLSKDALLGQDNIVEYKYPSKYHRTCKGITLDVYDVLQAFAVTNPATQHAIKKLLCAGLRGHKDKMQDLTEALKSIERAIELEKK